MRDDHSGIKKILDATLALIDTPKGCGVVLEGSIAEGFGNNTSDIDFLIVAEGGYDYPAMPTVIFADGHRVEFRMRSRAQLIKNAEAIAAAAANGRRRKAISKDRLDTYQRFMRGVPLVNPKLVEDIRSSLPEISLEPLVSEWFRSQACDSARYAVSLLALGQLSDAALQARIALVRAAKSWAAARGETYVGLKWVSEQLGRVGGHDDLLSGFSALASQFTARPASSEYVHRCLEMAGELGAGFAALDGHDVVLARRSGVTTWQLGDQVHLIRQRRDIFALSAEAAYAWRSMLFGLPLARVLQMAQAGTDMAGHFIAQFHRLGLVEMRDGRGRRIKAPGTYSLPPSRERPFISSRGLIRHDGSSSIRLSPLSAALFAAAGMSQVWANVEIENAREDMSGAMAGRQWGVARWSAYRILRRACHVLLISYGIYPAPNDDAPYYLGWVQEIPVDIKEMAISLDELIHSAPHDSEIDPRLPGSLDDFVGAVRDNIDSTVFPSSFHGGKEWASTLEIAYDWVRMGAYMDSDFPIEEARDLIRTGGAQPNLGNRSSPTS